ncbi:MAG: hypothetical protein GY866_13050 [Proteobacteria bacterium]|nr:hypothetical protein [Pseudomonadota bacterium]
MDWALVLAGSDYDLKKKFDFRQIEIEDNGPGMDDATRKRIFESFFTTKETDQATGLGLSVSYFIVADNDHGTMNVESQPGQGTKFIVRLPVEKGKPPTELTVESL